MLGGGAPYPGCNACWLVQTAIAITGLISFALIAFEFVVTWKLHAAADLRRALPVIRETLGDVVAHGGGLASSFTAAEVRAAEVELKDVIARLHDGKLRRHSRAVLAAWLSAFGFSSAHVPFVILDRPVGVEEAKRTTAQIEAARVGQDAIARVLDRIAILERFVLRPGGK